MWSRTYDPVGRLHTEIGPDYPLGWPLTNTYDGAGNRTQLQTAHGVFTYGYDERNRLHTLQDPGWGTTPSGMTTYAYDERGLRSRRDNPNGTRTTTTYDPLQRIEQTWHSQAGGTPIDHAFYAYDPVGNPQFKATALGTSTYTYDLLDRLKSENNPVSGLTTWTYDAASRRETQVSPTGIQTYTYDDADQLTTVTGLLNPPPRPLENLITLGAYPFLYQHPVWRGQVLQPGMSGGGTVPGTLTFTYDADGNRTGSTAPWGNTAYTWDPQDRLLEILSGTEPLLQNTYRPDGLRHSRSDASGIQTMIWDGDEVLSAEGATPQLYVKGVELTRALGPSLDRTYHEDALGTVEALTESDQTTEVQYAVDAWGNVLSGSAADNPYVSHGGLGYWREPSVELEYVRARWLDTKYGQWLSVDPISGEPRYSYARQQPSRHSDASGTQIDDEAPDAQEERYRLQLEGKYRFFANLPRHIVDWVAHFDPALFTVNILETIKGWIDGHERNWRDFVEGHANIIRRHPLEGKFIFRLIPGLIPVLPNGAWKSIRNTLGWAQVIVPPASDQPEALEYVGGFIWAVVKFIWDFTGGTVESILSLVRAIFSRIDIHKLLKSLIEFFWGFVHPIVELFNKKLLKDYDRGKLAGTLFGFVINLILLVKSAAKFIGGVVAVSAKLSGLPKVILSFAEDFRNKPLTPNPTSAVDASELQSSLEAKGKTPEQLLGEAQKQLQEDANEAKQEAGKETKPVVRDFEIGQRIQKPWFTTKFAHRRFSDMQRQLTDWGFKISEQTAKAQESGRITFAKSENIKGGTLRYEIYYDPADKFLGKTQANWHKVLRDTKGQDYILNDNGYIDAFGNKAAIGRVHIPVD